MTRSFMVCFAAGLTLPFAAAAQAQVEFLDKDPGTKVPIKIVAFLGPDVVRAGEFARVQIEVEIGAPWYIYALRPDAGGGPPTKFTLLDWQGETNGRINENRPDEELILETGSSVRVHKQRARFWTDVKFPKDLAPGPVAIKGTLAYAACNGKICLPLRVEPFLVEGMVEAGGTRQVPDSFRRPQQ